LTSLKSSSLALVMISSMSVPICNRFHVRQANSGKITTFRGYFCLTPSLTGLIGRRGSRLGLLKSALNTAIFYEVVSVYLQPFWRNLLLKCVFWPEITNKKFKPPILRVQGHLRLLMMTSLKCSSPALVIKQHVYA